MPPYFGVHRRQLVADAHDGPGLDASVLLSLPRTRGLYVPAAAGLEDLINGEGTREQDLQDFFERHPELLMGLEYGRAVPHPILTRDEGGPLIPDFMLEPVGGEFADVLDLKLPYEPVVVGTKDRLRASAKVMEAVAQVREYRAHFEDQRARQRLRDRYGLDAYMPGLAVVIGRRPDNQDAMQMRRLWASFGDVKVTTYDDLLLKVRRMGTL